jgi:hypothetical protein
MEGARIERWTTARTLMVSVRKDNGAVEPVLPADKTGDSELLAFVQSARELVFDASGSFPVFHAIGYYLNREPVELSVGAGFSLLLDYESEQEKSEWIVLILGVAVAYDVPVYPNTEGEAPLLAQHFCELHTAGVLAPVDGDAKVRLKLTRSPGEKIATFAWLDELKHTDSHCPAELVLIREAVRDELAKRDEATRVLGSLRLAISELEELLTRQRRNEHALQRALTRNPILFGPEYERVIPKHRLGAEFEMDYALMRVSGLVDLAEIERAT